MTQWRGLYRGTAALAVAPVVFQRPQYTMACHESPLSIMASDSSLTTSRVCLFASVAHDHLASIAHWQTKRIQVVPIASAEVLPQTN